MVARTCGSSSTSKIILVSEAWNEVAQPAEARAVPSFRRLAVGAGFELVRIRPKPVENVRIAVIDHRAPPPGRTRRGTGRGRRHRRELAGARARPLDDAVLVPFADIGAVEPVDPRADDPSERCAVEV